MWKQLYERLVSAKGRQLVRPTEDKIDAALDHAEVELAIRFPAQYRAFIHQFGPGELGGYFRFYGPVNPGFGDYGNDILEQNRSWRDPEGFWATTAQPELVSRLVCFSDTIGGDACFWDPKDLRVARTHEYGIYVLSHDSYDATVKEAAGSFMEFIENHCLGNEFVKIVGGHGWDEGGPPQEFRPACRTRKAHGP